MGSTDCESIVRKSDEPTLAYQLGRKSWNAPWKSRGTSLRRGTARLEERGRQAIQAGASVRDQSGGEQQTRLYSGRAAAGAVGALRLRGVARRSRTPGA